MYSCHRVLQQMSLSHPTTPEADSGIPVSTATNRSPNKVKGSPRDSDPPAPADSTKSPSMCLSPGLSPYASRTEAPVSMHNSVGWNRGFQQGLDVISRHIPQFGQQEQQPILGAALGQEAESASRSATQETKLEPLSKGSERDELVGDVEVLVPVIVSLGDKEKRSVTTEIPLKDIVNGTSCALEGTKKYCFQATSKRMHKILVCRLTARVDCLLTVKYAQGFLSCLRGD